MVWPDTVVFGDGSLIFIAYVALGIVAYGQLEHWNFQDTLYFLLTSCTTIGYGDMVPRSEMARAFTAVYVPLGFIPIFRLALPYGRAICQSVSGLLDGFVPSGLRLGPAKVTDIDRNDWDAARYLTALMGPLVVIAIGAGLSYRFLYFSPVEAVYFAATTLTTVGYGDLTPTDLPRMLATGFYGVVAAGTFFACVEQCYKIASSRQVKAIDLHKFVDEILLQESCWDSTWPDRSSTAGNGATESGQFVFARRADDKGLSEAEFVLGVLTAHSLIDVDTLVSVRKQFRVLMQTAEKAGVRVGEEGSHSEPRLDVRAVFGILQSEGKVRQRAPEQPEGEAFEVSVQEGQVASQTPGSLVDLTADDGGYGEWAEHVWGKRCKELRDKAAETRGAGAMGTESPPAAAGKAELV